MSQREKPTAHCRHRILVKGSDHLISVCTCGTFHLSFESATIRLSPEQFEAFSESALEVRNELAIDRHTPLKMLN